MVIHVENKILTHDGQANYGYVSDWFCAHFLLISVRFESIFSNKSKLRIN